MNCGVYTPIMNYELFVFARPYLTILHGEAPIHNS
jgi:hypothetical protein